MEALKNAVFAGTLGIKKIATLQIQTMWTQLIHFTTQTGLRIYVGMMEMLQRTLELNLHFGCLVHIFTKSIILIFMNVLNSHRSTFLV